MAGEIDVLACNGKSCDIYEVKCSRRIVKAKLQLSRLRKSIDKNNSNNKKFSIRHVYFYCGEADKIEKLSGKNKTIQERKEIELPPSIKNLY